MTLKYRLLLPLCTILLIFFALFEFFDYQHFRKTLESDLQFQASQLASLIVASLQDADDNPTRPHEELAELRLNLKKSSASQTSFNFTPDHPEKPADNQFSQQTEAFSILRQGPPSRLIKKNDTDSYWFQKLLSLQTSCLSCHIETDVKSTDFLLSIEFQAQRLQQLNRDRFLSHLGLDASILLLIFALLWYLLNQKLLTRFRQLNNAMTKHPEGQWVHVQGDGSGDEFDQIIDSFQKMKGKLEKNEIDIKEQHLQYHALFHNNHVVMLLTDPEAKQIIDANPAACSFYGYSHQDMLGMPISRINQTAVNELRMAVEKALNPQGSCFEFTHSMADGTHREVEVFTGPIQFKGRTLLYSIINDITERKAALEAVAESEQRFRTVAGFTYGWEYWLAPNGKLLYTSPSCQRITGYQPEDFFDNPGLLTQVVYPDDLNLFDMQREGSNGQWEQSLDFRIIHRNGSIHWVNQVCQPVRDDQGKPLGLRVSLHDIDERKAAEEELRKSQQSFQAMTERLRVLFDAIPDVLLLLNPDLSIVWANQAALRINNSPQSELIGKTCHEARFGKTTQCENCPAVKSFSSGQPENSMEAAPDGRFWGLRSFPVKNQAGDVTQVIELSSDITDKLKLQAETMRTGQLASLGELAAGVAHEINNPINGVINYAQILINQAKQQETRNEIAERILHESDRIAAIVSNLLSFAREKKEEKAPLKVHAVIGDALTLSEAHLRKDGIEIDLDLPPDLPRIIGRHQQLEQVFINLISNARYALNEKHPQGGPKKVLKINALSIEQDTIVRIQVEDHGPGIPSQVRDKIMNPFFSTKPAGQGTGLGLSISHGIIQDHGGHMNFETETGQFTRVLIDLPSEQGYQA